LGAAATRRLLKILVLVAGTVVGLGFFRWYRPAIESAIAATRA